MRHFALVCLIGFLGYAGCARRTALEGWDVGATLVGPGPRLLRSHAGDEATARLRLAEACTARQAGACIDLARWTEFGVGAPRDTTTAAELYRDQCTAGNQTACLAVQRLGVRAAHLANASCLPPDAGVASVGEGGLAKPVLGEVIRTYSVEIRYCYERLMQDGAVYEGSVATEFKIGWDGRVLEASVGKSDLMSRDALQCIVNQISQWRFPCPAGGGTVNVRYPWVLKADRSAER